MIQQKLNQKSKYLGQLSKDNPFFNLLQPIFTNLQQIFDIQVPPEPKVPKTQYNLKIYITQSQDQKLNNFVYTYSMPITLDKFIAMNQDFDLQKKLDINIGVYEAKQTINQKTKIMYLSYRKVLMISGRDFVYVRYNFKSENGKEYWVVSTSIPEQQQYPGIIRGSIVKSALRAVEKQGVVEVWVYSIVDMKMQMKPQTTKAKGVTQIKKYVQKCYEYFFGKKQANENSTKELQKQQQNV